MLGVRRYSSRHMVPPSFGSKYQVERLLGEGGMGRVFAARAENGERVAIKMLLPELARDRELVHRFFREARSASRIKSRHVARVLEVASMDDGTPFMVMEYLEGSDLAALVDQRGPLSSEVAVDYVLEACEALAEAHEHETIHRDLKPSNLFLAKIDGQEIVKVLDFGISKSIGEGHVSLAMTKTSTLLGSPSYMSPEQLRSAKDLDVRTDIYSLGVVLYQLVSATLPFDAATLPELSVLILGSDIAPPLASAPPGLARAVAVCLRKDRTQRFGNLADFADAIALYGTNRGKESAARIVARLGFPAVRADLTAASTLASTLPRSSSEAHVRPSGPTSQGGTLILSRDAESASRLPGGTVPGLAVSGDFRAASPSRKIVVGGGVVAVVLIAGLFGVAAMLRSTRALQEEPTSTASASAASFTSAASSAGGGLVPIAAIQEGPDAGLVTPTIPIPLPAASQSKISKANSTAKTPASGTAKRTQEKRPGQKADSFNSEN